MATSKAHYENVLGGVYSWMLGGFDVALARNRQFFDQHGISPRGSGIAVDLGAGCGFQSIPLAELGFEVTAIDLDAGLLDELRQNAGSLPIRAVEDDLTRVVEYARGAEIVVCMTDTLLHLDSRELVKRLFGDVQSVLEPGGRLILTFRDLTRELEGLDRFIPVRSDENTIFTCFLEFESGTVKVHDLVHRRGAAGWELAKSYYRKLRLSRGWVSEELANAGFDPLESRADRGLVTTIAQKPL
jgi:2-polyprenyl-3-methyl-5-hydroxy-6-metoxy-1,4-benzoquinol methylase